MAETFKPIQGWPGYEVGDHGTVVSLNYSHTGKRHKLEPGYSGTQGHSQVTLCRKGERPRKLYVHKLVAEAFLGPRPDGLVINHIDSDPTNNRADNLEYITQKQNINTPHCRAALSRAQDSVKRKVVATAPDGSTTSFKSIRYAAKRLGLKSCYVCSVLKGRQKRHHGYAFEYAEEA